MRKREDSEDSPLEFYLRGERKLDRGEIGERDRARFRRAMNRLSPDHRRFLELDLVESASPGQIELAMGLRPGSFKALKHAVMAALRDRMLEDRE